MGPRKVHHVDVIADTASIRGIVVIAEHRELLPQSGRGLRDEGHQVVRDPQGQLTDPRGGMRTDRVEVAEQGGPQVRIRGALIAQQPFTDDLGEAVRRHRIAVRGGLRDREPVGVAVHRTAGGKDEPLHPVPLHDPQEHHQGPDVVVVVLERFGHALAHRLVGREVDDAMHGTLLEHPCERLLVRAVHPVHLGVLANDPCDALKCPFLGVAQVVHDHRVIARLRQLNGGVRPDETRASGDDDPLHGGAR